MSGKPFTSAILTLSLAVAAPFAFAQQPLNDPPKPDSPAIEQRVDAMLSKLTLKQKLQLIGGVDTFYIRAEPSVGFPRLKMSDGPMGVRTWGPDTAYANGIGLAATWDPSLERAVGVAMGDDARARGVNFILGPGVDIYRAPMAGRSFEYFGEDPYLDAHTAVPYIEGIQSQGVVATIKHFALNNQEYARLTVSSDIGPRALHEIYLPAFEAAVKVAHVGAIMDSYNLVNGVHSTQSHLLNVEILRHEWGFKGIVMSDWGATHSAVGAANNGLDLEMPSGEFMNPKNLLPAIQDGQVSEATINQKVRRIFRTAVRFGFLDRPQTDLNFPLYSQSDNKVALRGALESITLLKNQGHLLPLDEDKIHTIAVFGPDAWPAVPGAGGSSHVTPFQDVSILTGISNYLGERVKVLYARGLPTTSDIFQGTRFVGSTTGPWWTSKSVKIQIFDNSDFQGTPHVMYAPVIAAYQSPMQMPPSQGSKSVRITATYMPKTTGTYMVLAADRDSGGYIVYLDGKELLHQKRQWHQDPKFVDVPMTAGTPVKLRVDYLPNSNSFQLGVGIHSTDDLVSPEVAKLAKMADATMVAVGFDPVTESEGKDRSYHLPWGQVALIQAVAAANPKTIVTLTAGGGVATADWIHKVPVFLDDYYPGQAGGTAIAEILFGQHSPEGHLPFSFAKSWEQNPTYHNYYPAPVAPGQTPHVHYAEGVFVGYRYYTTKHIQPLFPFGYGLSYTTFSFSNLKVTPETASPHGPITVSFDVTNTGSRKGADVAQLYVGDPSAHVARPVKELKGYEKVRLEPGQSRQVTLHLNYRSLAYWDTAKNNWQVDPGKFVVYVGDSSENTPLTQSFEVK